MNKKAQQAFTTLQSELSQIMKTIAHHNNKTLNKIPQNGWSVLQVFHHLLMAERGGLGYLKKKLSHQQEFSKIGWQGKIRQTLLKLSLRSPFKYKAPKAISGDNLPKESSLEDVKKLYETTRKEAKSFLETLPDDLFEKVVYNHPLAGRISILGMIQFWMEHQRRHAKQIRNILMEN